ncbi:nicotinamidase/pyrazinamidase [Sphingomonas gellani]|uniref:nicotinamidase n=1 Tax=Sphingomonas gellani TaxID=1166340 RepID=A0A1H8B3N2_9SPHN|nr:isochorismatase family protein [Sphingomonas gellani]SEM76698.1 nicotinamidase/pyrazinamidase [Sphingomonas gellani]
MKSFVIVVDAQADFLLADGALPVAGAEALFGPMQDWIAALRPDDTAGVLFTFDTHDADTYPLSAEALQFPIHCVRDTAGWRGMLDPDAIDPAIPLFRLEKNVFDMWAEPGVTIDDMRNPAAPAALRDAFFAQLRASGVETVTLIGVAADFCVRWAARGLIERGFRVTVPPALTRGIERQIEAVVAADFA